MEPTSTSECGTVKLWQADCRDVLPTLEPGSVDAVVTDPPYGIDFGRGGGFSASHGWGPWREKVGWDKERPSKDCFDTMLALAVPTSIWGGNYFTDYLPPSSKWLIWDKGQTDFSLADCEIAWCSWGGATRRIMYPRALALRDGKVHPTQKPIEVMTWNIRHLPPGCDSVLDCYLGSGTTGVAAVRLGRRFLGIEIDPGYFAIAKCRILEALNSQPLFKEQASERQEQMF